MRARDQRLARREERRIDLGESVRELEIDHPRDERALECGAGATQNVEARARHLGSARDVEDPELLTDLPVRLGGEGALGWHVLADDLVVVLTGPAGSLSVEHVRDVQHELVALGLEGGELALQRLDPLPHLAHVRLHVLARRPAATRFIALGVERLDLAPEVARLPVERQDALEGRRDVYDGEDGKWRDFSRTVPAHLADVVIASAAEGRKSVLLFEDWQTADAAIATAAILNVRMPGAAAILWNANNTYGFGSVDFPLLRLAASITTVSRFMRAEMSAVGVDAAVLPNGIAERFLKPLPPSEARPLREAFGDRPTFVKVARFDQDKRWLWAIDAIAFMRDTGARPRLLMRGSRSPYGDIVGARIRARGLSIERVALSTEAATRDLAAAVAASTADIVFLDYFIPERTLRALYQAADGVLANSEKEPFGLVGLEVMASGGLH